MPLAAALLAAVAATPSPSPAVRTVPVTVVNFPRAETDMYFADEVKRGAFGKFLHRRELVPVDQQAVVRPNRDTLYSTAIFDLDAGRVTLTLPDPGDRFMSLQLIDEDHYVPMVAYGGGTYVLLREHVGTPYVMAVIRILVNPLDPADLEKARALQDQITVEQPAVGTFTVPNWDPVSQKKVRSALLTLGETLPDLRKAFGSPSQVDPTIHLIGTAMGWGGNPDKEAMYLNVTPPKNDGTTVHKLTVRYVPVNGFWSISVYNAQGYFQKNLYGAYSLNNKTVTYAQDNSATIQFGGCDGKVPNCLPIMPNWNYTVRLYRPNPEVLNGGWKFPEAVPVSK
ncbi:MAG TPA: DUF1254 domain-containing protein [Candidatus Polarisedimenticolaceae bacterium]|nr:DUF1254 domain-containing protein [Candidatus Polarisedimenticolaceae bacterium]